MAVVFPPPDDAADDAINAFNAGYRDAPLNINQLALPPLRLSDRVLGRQVEKGGRGSGADCFTVQPQRPAESGEMFAQRTVAADSLPAAERRRALRTLPPIDVQPNSLQALKRRKLRGAASRNPSAPPYTPQSDEAYIKDLAKKRKQRTRWIVSFDRVILNRLLFLSEVVSMYSSPVMREGLLHLAYLTGHYLRTDNNGRLATHVTAANRTVFTPVPDTFVFKGPRSLLPLDNARVFIMTNNYDPQARNSQTLVPTLWELTKNEFNRQPELEGEFSPLLENGRFVITRGRPVDAADIPRYPLTNEMFEESRDIARIGWANLVENHEGRDRAKALYDIHDALRRVSKPYLVDKKGRWIGGAAGKSPDGVVTLPVLLQFAHSMFPLTHEGMIQISDTVFVDRKTRNKFDVTNLINFAEVGDAGNCATGAGIQLEGGVEEEMPNFDNLQDFSEDEIQRLLNPS